MRTLHPKTRRWIAPLCTLFLALACTPWQAHALTFNDVDVTTPHQEDIVWLAENGISTGYSGGLFKPMTDVYRQDMAAFLYRLAGKPDYAPTPADKARFKDVNDQTPHAKEIYWLAASGVSTGYLDGTFKPLAPVVRQDMAAFLRRLAKVMGDPESEKLEATKHQCFPRCHRANRSPGGYSMACRDGDIRGLPQQDVSTACKGCTSRHGGLPAPSERPCCRA